MSDDVEPPLVLREEDEPPMVRQAEPAPPRRPRPGFWEACLFTLGFWVVLAGTMMAIILPAIASVAFGGNGDAPRKPLDDPWVRTSLAWAMPGSYLAAFIYCLVVVRVVVGRTWTHDLGLTRLPPYHLILALLALPGFMVLSEALAALLKPLDRAIFDLLGGGDVGDMNAEVTLMLQGYPAWFLVLAIGIGPGVVEEFWCRGYLGRGLIARNGWIPGVVLTSLFFGVLHGWPPSYVLVTASMGACLHFVYIASRSLWAPMAMHLCNNSFAALAASKAIATDGIDAAVQARGVPILVAALGLLLFCGLAMWHARWTWPGETPGILVPPESSPDELTRNRIDGIYTIAAAFFCAVLLGLLLL
ncbi:MAG TPA: CPBP family intramembrane glutamic endopeptidase [Urbifossiella sp.]|nr:CPBP family intramembrane glutamic endopeptidase [Urbifossiella sp.]